MDVAGCKRNASYGGLVLESPDSKHAAEDNKNDSVVGSLLRAALASNSIREVRENDPDVGGIAQESRCLETGPGC